MYASSEENYNDFYLELNLLCLDQLLEYFNVNWHNIKEDWSLYSLMKNNLGNTTNNRLESINAKLKQVITKNSPLVITIKDFFEWYDSHNNESQLRTAKQFLRKPNLPFDVDSPEQQYVKSLTKYASDIVLKELNKSKKIVFTEVNKLTKVCRMNNLEVSATSCQCVIHTSFQLPCRHIFAARYYFHQPLFDTSLFNQRWSKNQLLAANYSCSTALMKNSPTNVQVSVVTKKIKKNKTQSLSQKRKIVQTKIAKLVNIVSMSCGTEFDRKMKVLDNLIEKFSNNEKIKIIHADDEELETSFRNLSIDNSLIEGTEMYLNIIKTPSKIKVIGRPSEFLKTTANMKKNVKKSHKKT